MRDFTPQFMRCVVTWCILVWQSKKKNQTRQNWLRILFDTFRRGRCRPLTV